MPADSALPSRNGKAIFLHLPNRKARAAKNGAAASRLPIRQPPKARASFYPSGHATRTGGIGACGGLDGRQPGGSRSILCQALTGNGVGIHPQSVTAPTLAVLTCFAYLASTPRV